jgi:microcin C transport system substrate-binding protein
VRRAFNLAFDFEWSNKNLFYDQYTRIGSYFDNSELQAVGLPGGTELELLNALRNEVPPEVFTMQWKNPVNATPEDVRRHLGEAARLLAQAGWTPKDGVLTNARGVELRATFLLNQSNFERVVLPYIAALNKLGIKADLRVVDSSQYQQRLNTFDFDIAVATFPQSESPGNEQRDFWASDAAGKEGSRNIIGIKNQAIDNLIDRIIHAKDRQWLVAATRALDRVLLWNNYVVPQWYTPFERLAYWDMYRHPQRLPARAASFLRVWWWDGEAAKRLNAAPG